MGIGSYGTGNVDITFYTVTPESGLQSYSHVHQSINQSINQSTFILKQWFSKLQSLWGHLTKDLMC